MALKRVLLVEDDDDFREALVGNLVDRGFSVEHFSNGLSLLRTVERCLEADIVVLDWNLPDIPGIDVLLELRRRGIAAPVVFLTGYSVTTNESRALDAGASDFVGKERGVDVLVRRLAVALQSALLNEQPEVNRSEEHT